MGDKQEHAEFLMGVQYAALTALEALSEDDLVGIAGELAHNLARLTREAELDVVRDRAFRAAEDAACARRREKLGEARRRQAAASALMRVLTVRGAAVDLRALLEDWVMVQTTPVLSKRLDV